jgi:leucyl aminopeptidase
MDVRVSTRDVTQFDGDALAVGVFAGGKLEGPAAALDRALAGVLSELQQSGEIRGRADEVTLLHTLGKIEPARVVIMGLGPRDRYTLERARRAAAIACRTLRNAGSRNVGLALAWAESGINLAQAARAQTEGALLGLYRFQRYKTREAEQWRAYADAQAERSTGAAQQGETAPGSARSLPRVAASAMKAASETRRAAVGIEPSLGADGQNPQHQRAARERPEIQSITILGRGREPALRAAVERGRILAEAQNVARDLGNEPPNVLTPTEFAERARRMAQEVGLECEIYGPDWMREHDMGALLGVARGSDEEPRLIVLRYRGGTDEPGLGLVGKGITFDTGGISIKPAADMDAMKFDMCGGAAVVGAMKAIAQLKPAINVTGLVPTTENMPGGRAYHPGDILRASNGKTVEILNTDAEGRLILADALSYATSLGLSPLVDAATLTGAIVVSLGHVRAGLFSNAASLEEKVMAAAGAAGERLWPMPMDLEYDELIHSEIADVKQTGGRAGGSIAAAKVLSHFVDDTPWAHLDIAGVAWRDRREPEGEKGATGFGVRIFAELALELAERRP